jgi:hypothetical protein
MTEERNDHSKAGTIWTDNAGDRYTERMRNNQEGALFEVQLSPVTRPDLRAWYSSKDIAELGLAVECVAFTLALGSASRLPHGYETDHAALRAIVTLYSEATTDATIAYYAAPCDGPEHKASLARMGRLDVATNELRSRLARTYPESARDRLADLARGEHLFSLSDRTWRERLSADALARLDGDMSRPLPESADLDVLPAEPFDPQKAQPISPAVIEAARALDRKSEHRGMQIFIETHDEHPIEHG